MKTKPKLKWKFAIGTTSRVPNMAGQHYLILDLDTKKHTEYPPSALTLMGGILQKTQHGWHVYTPYYGPFHHILKLAKEHGADKQWLSIGKKRGYLFLADKDEIRIPWPVERMVIYAKKAAQDTSQSGLSIQKNNNPRSGLQEILAPILGRKQNRTKGANRRIHQRRNNRNQGRNSNKKSKRG